MWCFKCTVAIFFDIGIIRIGICFNTRSQAICCGISLVILKDIITIRRHLQAQLSRWRHQMEQFSALLAICAGNSPVTGEFPTQRPVTQSFDVFFDLRLNKRLGKQSWGWWFETPSRPFWRHCNDNEVQVHIYLKDYFVIIQHKLYTLHGSRDEHVQ